VINLRAGLSENRGSILDRGSRLLSSAQRPEQLWGSASPGDKLAGTMGLQRLYFHRLRTEFWGRDSVSGS
jgi:hypothetical protein